VADLTVEPDTDSPHNPLLQVSLEAREGVVIVRAVGDIDLGTAPLLSQHLTQGEAQLTPPGPLVLDMTGVEFLASVGLSELIKHSKQCTDLGSRLIVVATQRAVLRSLNLTGLTETISVVASVEDALGAETTD
jgi:anti-sigma B factor antagonist